MPCWKSYGAVRRHHFHLFLVKTEHGSIMQCCTESMLRKCCKNEHRASLVEQGKRLDSEQKQRLCHFPAKILVLTSDAACWEVETRLAFLWVLPVLEVILASTQSWNEVPASICLVFDENYLARSVQWLGCSLRCTDRDCK